jgi:hypothetical protein
VTSQGMIGQMKQRVFDHEVMVYLGWVRGGQSTCRGGTACRRRAPRIAPRSPVWVSHRFVCVCSSVVTVWVSHRFVCVCSLVVTVWVSHRFVCVCSSVVKGAIA